MHGLTQVWRPSAAPTGLAPDEVHVWCASLERSAARTAELVAHLSPEEHERAQRYRCAQKRNEFLVGRGLLRQILAGYTGLRPQQLRFRTGPVGKPSLDTPHLGSQLHFNLSHSHGLALYAVTYRGEVGVDVEHVRPFANDLDLAARYFSAGEVRTLRTLPAEHRTEAFFHAWTRKEAFLKACGTGLSYGIDRVEVTLAPDDGVRIVHLDGAEHAAERWSLRSLRPASGYVGALALEDHDYRLVLWQVPEDCLAVASAG